MTAVEFGVYVPQLALSFDEMVQRAVDCERLGYDSMWLFDHFYGPGTPDVPSYEAWTIATALLARTTALRVGHLVLCNSFRHPALLAKMATTLDVISGGRLDFGIGSGSVEEEHHQVGLPWGSMRERSERLGETLEIITRMFSSPRTTFEGVHYTVHDLPNIPAPVQQPRPPIHVGGAGPRFTVPLVARYADVWNVPTYALDRIDELNDVLDAECEHIGRDPHSIRRSLEGVLAVAPAERLDEAIAVARRRFGAPGFGLDAGGFVGTPAQVTERVGQLVDKGFSSLVLFPYDRGQGDALTLFATEVMAHFATKPSG